MKWLAVFLILFAPGCASAREYVFLPAPGHWNNTHTQYENKHILYVDGVSYCKSDINKPLNKPQCDYWSNITWRKGKIDRNEALVGGFATVGFLYDGYQTVGAIGRGCIEVGSLGLLGKTPGWGPLLVYDAARAAPFWVAAHRTPLAYSSATHMLAPAAYFGIGAIRAGLHAAGCHR